ncbi:hypothetical protein Tcan_00553, partial [Toxocara canis]
ASKLVTISKISRVNTTQKGCAKGAREGNGEAHDACKGFSIICLNMYRRIDSERRPGVCKVRNIHSIYAVAMKTTPANGSQTHHFRAFCKQERGAITADIKQSSH